MKNAIFTMCRLLSIVWSVFHCHLHYLSLIEKCLSTISYCLNLPWHDALKQMSDRLVIVVDGFYYYYNIRENSLGTGGWKVAKKIPEPKDNIIQNKN